MKANKAKAILAAATLAVQCAAVGWLVWRYESIVRGGTEVRFRCEAYDPYDPLRGRYLMTTVRESCQVDGHVNECYGLKGYVKLLPSTNGLWRVAAVENAPGKDGGIWVKPRLIVVEHAVGWSEKRDDETWEDFQKRQTASPWVARVSFPDQLFVNEHIAPAAEKVLRDATSAKGRGAVAVYRAKGGEIVLVDIEIDGKSVLALARDAAKND